MIRLAKLEEAQTLTNLMRRSKAHWGYDADFMADAEAEMTVRTEDFISCKHYILEIEGQPAGFSSLCDRGEVVLLDNLFIEPKWIGQGVGRQLWDHAVSFAQKEKLTAIILVSDPNALGFYQKMGAVVVGESQSGIRPGRMLPRMRYEIK